MKQALTLMRYSLYDLLFWFNIIVYRRLQNKTVDYYSPVGAQSLTFNLPENKYIDDEDDDDDDDDDDDGGDKDDDDDDDNGDDDDDE